MPRLRIKLILAGAAVAAVLIADSSGLLDNRTAVAVDNAAQLVAGLLAAVCCGWTARQLHGVQRRWRQLMAVGMIGWSVGQVIWSWYQLFTDTPLPAPSWSDAGYLTLPVFAFAALLVVAADGTDRHAARSPRDGTSACCSRMVLALDSLMVVGSLFILTWATALGAVVRAEAPNRLAFAVAVAYPVTDLLLVVMVVLLLATRPLSPPLRPQLVLLGAGLVALALSDSIFAYLISSGAATMPPIADLGFIAGPVLIAAAALTRGGAASRANEPPVAPVWRRGQWTHLLLPYLPLTATGVLVVLQSLSGSGPDVVERAAGMAVVVLVVLRQMITLIENNRLLYRVSDAQDKLRHQAFHDPLTGLANRALFNRRLATAMEGNRRDGQPLALLFVDLDDFKAVNDSLGHAAGDQVLWAVAERLRGCVRDTDTVARLGGDEFGVLLHGDDDLDVVSQRILTALRQPFVIDGRSVSIGASLGAAVPDNNEQPISAEALLHRADAAMYVGKRRGKGLLVNYDPPGEDSDPAAGDRADESGDGLAELPTLLAETLAERPEWTSLQVRYQPIVRLTDGARVAVEALARWTHPRFGPIPANIFVPMAERAGLVAALDDFVLDRACRDIAGHLATHGWAPMVHVNVSAGRLGHPDVERAVHQTLDRYGLSGEYLVLEVTESRRIPDLPAAAGSLGRLRSRGVQLALDDFATGYNTLAQMHLLPVDIIKLDRALSGVVHSEPRAGTLCRSVVAIAASLGIRVIAEGVETAEQEAALRRVGCGFGQGYLYARPTSLADAALRAPAPA